MIDTPEKREITKEEALEAIQNEYFSALNAVDENMGEIGHGEAKRLLRAIFTYPRVTEDFKDESEAFRKIYSALKIGKDADILVGAEVFMEELKERFNAENKEEGEQNG